MLAATCLLAAAAVAPAGALAGTPSQDQYTFNLPTPHGQKPTGGHAPSSHPGSLSSSQRQATSGPQGQQLRQIATSPELGAPSTQGTGSGGNTGGAGGSGGSGKGGSGGAASGNGGSSSGSQGLSLAGTSPAAPAAVGHAAGADPVIWLLVALAAIAGSAAFLALRRRRRAGR